MTYNTIMRMQVSKTFVKTAGKRFLAVFIAIIYILIYMLKCLDFAISFNKTTFVFIVIIIFCLNVSSLKLFFPYNDQFSITWLLKF